MLDQGAPAPRYGIPGPRKLLRGDVADLHARDGRSDRKGYSLLMNAVVYRNWKEAAWFLEHGVSPDVKGEGGTTVASLLKDTVDRVEDPERKAFVKALSVGRVG